MHAMTRLFSPCTDKCEVFSHFLAIANVDFCCKHASYKIQTCKIDTILCATNHKYSIATFSYCGIGYLQCPPPYYKK